ncbi:unnamed protein product, partial [marine sediment metagenome]
MKALPLSLIALYVIQTFFAGSTAGISPAEIVYYAIFAFSLFLWFAQSHVFGTSRRTPPSWRFLYLFGGMFLASILLVLGRGIGIAAALKDSSVMANYFLVFLFSQAYTSLSERQRKQFVAALLFLLILTNAKLFVARAVSFYD